MLRSPYTYMAAPYAAKQKNEKKHIALMQQIIYYSARLYTSIYFGNWLLERIITTVATLNRNPHSLPDELNTWRLQGI